MPHVHEIALCKSLWRGFVRPFFSMKKKNLIKNNMNDYFGHVFCLFLFLSLKILIVVCPFQIMSFSQVFNNTFCLTQNLLKQFLTSCLKLAIAMFPPMSASEYNKILYFFFSFILKM